MRPLKLTPLTDALLFKSYMELYRETGQSTLLSHEFPLLFSIRVPRRLLEICAQGLLNEGYFEFVPKADKPRVRLTLKGIAAVETMLENKGSVASRMLAGSDDVLYEIAGIGPTPLPSRDRDSEAKDQWTPLKIDRESDEFKSALAATEEALEKVRSDNGYAASAPEERNAILESLQAGIDRLKSAATVEQVRSLILGPLSYLARKFLDTGIGEVAKRAFSMVSDWLLRSLG